MNHNITITEKAREYLLSQLSKTNQTNVLLQAKGGGCAGYRYDWSYPEKNDLNENDTYINLDEKHFLIIDAFSAFKLFGMSIDFVETLSGSSLELINPNAVSTCGCGESFSA